MEGKGTVKVANSILKTGERLDDLIRDNLKIIQNHKYFCFSIDAVLLAHFCTIKKGDNIIDLGTGSGVIPLLLSLRKGISSITGIELQEALADMGQRSVTYNNLNSLIEIRHGDIRSLDIDKKFDLVTSNPPYRTMGEGKVNPALEKAMAKHEVTCNLEDVVKAASKLLTDSGRLAMVHRPYRLTDIINIYRKYNIEPKRLRLVYPFVDKDPNLVLIEGIKGGSSYLEVEKPLIVYSAQGVYSQEVLKFYYGTNG